MSTWIEHFWSVQWDLPKQSPLVAETLPHPCIHLVVEDEAAVVHGLRNGRFTRTLSERGRVFGIKFRPAGFHPFLRAPLSGISNQSLPLGDVFGQAGSDYGKRIQATADVEQCVPVAEEFLRRQAVKPDPRIEQVNEWVDRVVTDRSITHVEHLVSIFGVGLRSLQRLFSTYVGVSPKWVIQRYRLHEASERLAKDAATDLAQLSLELGYFDQAHFVRDFKALVGKSPGAYAKQFRKNES